MGKKEKFAYKIEELLQKKKKLYKKLYNTLEKEKNYIVDIDVDSLWSTISRKKSLILSIECIRQEIACLFNETHSSLNLNDQIFRLSNVIKAMNFSSEKKAEIERLRLEINTIKSDIASRSFENKNFINKYLSIVDGVFSTVLNIEDEKEYNNSGTVLNNNVSHLISTEM